MFRTDGTGPQIIDGNRSLPDVKLNERSITPIEKHHEPENMEFSPDRVSIQNCFMTQVGIDTPGRAKAGVKRIKKANLKIDMTPMVDLGFLLISFFIFTTEISKPAVTNLYFPKDGDSTKVPQSKSLTILLDSNDQIFYYNGDMNEAIKNNEILPTSYDETSGIGNVIRQRQDQLTKRKIDKRELIVLIKPYINSSYKNVVDILDEMLINEVTRYMITDPENGEIMFLEHPNRSR